MLPLSFPYRYEVFQTFWKRQGRGWVPPPPALSFARLPETCALQTVNLDRQPEVMPRGNPKKPTIIRLDPALISEFRVLCGREGNFSAAAVEGLHWCLRSEKRRREMKPPKANRQTR
jgi:hypothetical protein